MGRKKVKSSTASKGGAAEQPASDMDVKLLNLEAKVDQLVDVVAKMGEKVQAQTSATPLSPVPAAHSSLRVDEEGNKQIPTFEELKSDAQIQAEVAKILHQIGCQRPIALQSLLDVNLNVHGVKIKVNTTGVVFDVKLHGVTVS